MRRLVLAVAAAALLGPSALAQLKPSVPVPHPGPIPPPPTYAGPPGPAIPIFKSGGLYTGTLGYYTYDTGDWLLGGTAVSRQAGYFTMVYPGASLAIPASDALPLDSGPYYQKHRLFHHR